MRHRLASSVLCVAAVAAATGLAYGLRPLAPDLTLGVVYVVPVVAAATLYGLAYAIAVSIASMLAFNFFFLPPVHSLALRDSANWIGLAVYLATAVVVSDLASRSRRRAQDAEQREREATFLANVSARLLERGSVTERLAEIAAGIGSVLQITTPRIELDSLRRPDRGEVAYDLAVGRRHVGRLFGRSGATDAQACARVTTVLASLLASAVDRERLSRAAVEAETLRRSDAVKTAVLRAVSHDLRSPITAIRAAGEGLERSALSLDEGDRHALLTTIRAESARLERLVTNLIDLSRLEAGAAVPRPELWTADELIARALDTLGPTADRVVVALPARTAATRVDATQIERVLVNVIENALKFSVAPVDITASTNDDALVITIRDHGSGIDARDAKRLFEPFEVGRDPAAGSGLGLAIANGFAQANGAELTAAPAKDGGTIFTLALPRGELPAEMRT